MSQYYEISSNYQLNQQTRKKRRFVPAVARESQSKMNRTSEMEIESESQTMRNDMLIYKNHSIDERDEKNEVNERDGRDGRDGRNEIDNRKVSEVETRIGSIPSNSFLSSNHIHSRKRKQEFHLEYQEDNNITDKSFSHNQRLRVGQYDRAMAYLNHLDHMQEQESHDIILNQPTTSLNRVPVHVSGYTDNYIDSDVNIEETYLSDEIASDDFSEYHQNHGIGLHEISGRSVISQNSIQEHNNLRSPTMHEPTNADQGVLIEDDDPFLSTEIDEGEDHKERLLKCLEEVSNALHTSIPVDVPLDFSISNLVLSVHLTGSLNLQKLYTRLKNAELKSEDVLQFQTTTDYGRIVCTIRKSGKLGLTGSKTIKEALQIVRFIARLAEKFGAYNGHLFISYCRICNIVATTDLKESINLDKLFRIMQKDVQQKHLEQTQIAMENMEHYTKDYFIEDVSYEPEVFSALKVTFVGNVVLQVFANGRMHGMGATKLQQFYDFSHYIIPMLKQAMGEGHCAENAILIS